MRTGGLYAFTGLPYRFPKPLYATVLQEARLLGETPVLAPFLPTSHEHLAPARQGTAGAEEIQLLDEDGVRLEALRM